MGSLWKNYKQMPDLLLKPEKNPFDVNADLFESEEMIHGVEIIRHDFEFKNDDEFTVKCHLFYPEDLEDKKINLVCFLHTRGGSALEGKFLIKTFLPSTAILLFDFAASGNSEGEYITLGMNETRDFKKVLTEAKKLIKVNKVCLWGRSMGAVTAIMYTKIWNNQEKFFDSEEEKARKLAEKEKKTEKKNKKNNDDDPGEINMEQFKGDDIENDPLNFNDETQNMDMEKDLLGSGVNSRKPSGVSGEEITHTSSSNNLLIPSTKSVSKSSKVKKSAVKSQDLLDEMNSIIADFGKYIVRGERLTD